MGFFRKAYVGMIHRRGLGGIDQSRSTQPFLQIGRSLEENSPCLRLLLTPLPPSSIRTRGVYFSLRAQHLQT